MNSIQVTLGISMFFVCCTYVRSYVLTDSGTKGVRSQSNDIENRLLFLAKFLEKMDTFTGSDVIDTDVTDTGVALQKTNKTSTEQDLTDVGSMIQNVDKTESEGINLDKKDYAILPPASEWCRLMGFRRCRGSSS